MMAVVKEVRPARTTGDFERAVGDLKGLVSKNPVTVAEERREPNPHGHDHWRFLGEERSPNGRVMVAMSVTWWNKSHAVVMIFEGQHRLASEAGQDQELQGYQGAARLILSSVR